MVWVQDARRETRRERAQWERVRNAERYYAAQLRKIARQIADVVNAFGADSPQAIEEIGRTLQRYSELITPWSRAVARRMLFDVARRDERAWRRYAKLLGEQIRADISDSTLTLEFNRLLEQQVDLITSIPREAAQRVQELATRNIYEGGRTKEIVDMVMASGDVSRARANLIARTEVGRAATVFTQVRAQAIGSEGYVWRTARDRRVRLLHRKLEGTMHRWDDPPIAGERGERAHPGSIYNCRCYPEPVLPKS